VGFVAVSASGGNRQCALVDAAEIQRHRAAGAMGVAKFWDEGLRRLWAAEWRRLTASDSLSMTINRTRAAPSGWRRFPAAAKRRAVAVGYTIVTDNSFIETCARMIVFIALMLPCSVCRA
jgi:hypothetical protein